MIRRFSPLVALGFVVACIAAANAQGAPGSVPPPATVNPNGGFGQQTNFAQFVTLNAGIAHIQNYALGIFKALFAIELTYAVAMWIAQTKDSNRLLVDYVVKIAQAGAMILLIQNAPTALTFTVNAARCLALDATIGGATGQTACDPAQLGSASIATPLSTNGSTTRGSTFPTELASGAMDPGSVMAFGIQLSFNEMLQKPIGNTVGATIVGVGENLSHGDVRGAAAAVATGAASTILGTVIALIAALAMSLAFVLLSLELAGVTLEAVLVGNIGIIFLGFLGHRWTAKYGHNFISYGLAVAARIFVIYVFVGVGEVFVWNTEQQLSASGSWTLPTIVMSVAVIFMLLFMVKRMDKITAAFFKGQSSFSGLHDVVIPTVVDTIGATLGASALASGGAKGLSAISNGLKKNTVSNGGSSAAFPRGGGPDTPSGDWPNEGAMAVPVPKSLTQSAPSNSSRAIGQESASSANSVPAGNDVAEASAPIDPTVLARNTGDRAARAQQYRAANGAAAPAPNVTSTSASDAPQPGGAESESTSSATSSGAATAPPPSSAIEKSMDSLTAAVNVLAGSMNGGNQQQSRAKRLRELTRRAAQAAAQYGHTGHGGHHIDFKHHE